MTDVVKYKEGKRVSLRYQAPRVSIVRRAAVNPKPPEPEKPKRDYIEVGLRGAIKPEQMRLMTDMERIIYAASKVSGVSVNDIKSGRRAKHVCFVRQAIMFLTKERTRLSLPTIGRMLGGKDHSTVHHGVTKVMNNYERFAELIEKIKAISTPVDDMGISQDMLSPSTDERGKIAA